MFSAEARMKGSKKQKAKNAHKRWRKKLTQKVNWLPSYWAQVKVLDPKSEEEVWDWLAFHLPHEIVVALEKLSDARALLMRDGLDHKSLKHLLKCEPDAER